MHRGPDSGSTPDSLSLCQDDINLIVMCFSAVFKNVVTTYVFLKISI